MSSRKFSYDHPERDFVCVFDLDSTLFDLTDRKQQILLSYLKSDSPFDKDILKNVEVKKNEFGIDEALKRIHFPIGSKYYEHLRAYWQHYFFHNDFLKYDRCFEGAVDYVHKVVAAGAHIIYLTGRDEPRMLKGTLESLISHGFPLGGANIEVRLKPNHSIDDHVFKLEFMKTIHKKFEEIWIFENEPVNINLIEKHYPGTNFVFIDSNHSGIEEISAHHPPIKDFR